MTLRAEAYLTLASTWTSPTADSVLILTMRAVRVILTTRNYPGRLHIPVSIIPCAQSSTLRLIASFLSASRQPHHQPHYQGPQPTHAHHRLSTQRQQSPPDSLSNRSTDSGYSSASAPPSTNTHTLQLDTAHMNPALSSVSVSTTLVDPSIAGSGNGPRRSSGSVRTMHGFRRDCPLQVQNRTRSMSATRSSHVTLVLRSTILLPLTLLLHVSFFAPRLQPLL
ncbi:hypothetical protein V8E53_012358 [Lactarius tabidus]|jgi:hypothetical protein